jgi:Ca-activated chloride channel family protein
MSRVCPIACSFMTVAVVGGMILHAEQRPSFRSDVELISLTVSVTGPGGRYVSGLSADDFDISEDGQPQEIGYFSPANTALSISLLLDSSSSMEERMPLAQRAATEFVARLRANDIAQIVDFDSRVEVLQPFTSDRSLLEIAIQRTRAGGSTALYNAVYIALRQFEKMRTLSRDEVRRDVIVVLSDGDDTSSLVTFDELLDAAKRSQTVIYTIGLGLDAPAGRLTPATGEFGLRRLAQETGGRLFLAKRPEDLSDVYTTIADELTSQYVLGYLSRNDRRDAGWRSIAVRVHRPQLLARTRAGYYATARSNSP